MRASLVVNCQSALIAAALRRCCQAWTWRSSVALSPTRPGSAEPAPAQAGVAVEGAQLDLGHVQPGAVLGRVVDFETVGETLGLCGRERFVERGRGGGVELVHDQDELGRR